MASTTPKQKIKIALSIDFDAISGWLGTSQHPDNNMADISSGYFSGYVGVPRLLKVFSRLGISDKVTWCIPGHSLETFPEQAKSIAESGAEIALHGYSHEGSTQMTAQQEKDVLVKTMELVENLTGKKPRGYRAPLYQIQERTVRLLQEHDFLWGSSLAHLDSKPYFLPKEVDKLNTIEFSPDKEASSWMKPSKDFLELEKNTLVEIPCNWYMEVGAPIQLCIWSLADGCTGYDAHAVFPQRSKLSRLCRCSLDRAHVDGPFRVAEERSRRWKGGHDYFRSCPSSRHVWNGTCDWNDPKVLGLVAIVRR